MREFARMPACMCLCACEFASMCVRACMFVCMHEFQAQL